MTDNLFDRANPMVWQDEPVPDGVFVGDGEEGLQLLGLPQGPSPMARRLELEKLRQAELSDEVKHALTRLTEALNASAADRASRRIDLSALTPAGLALVRDVLGQGEASAQIATPQGDLQAAESVFAGLWLVQPENQPDQVWAEVADVPCAVRETMAAMPPRPMPLEHLVPPDGTMNVMGVLAEIRHVSGSWRPGQANHVMNFTLLPMTEPDVAFLAAMLGTGPIRIASGGYGAARIIATAVPQVWAVQYLNSMGMVILDTLEIGDVPRAACAGLEDFEDSATRLTHILAGDL